MKHIPSSIRIWSFWLVLGIIFLFFLSAIKAILLPFVIGMLVAYFLDPAADKIETLGASRNVATSIITLAFFSTIVAGLAVLMPIIYEQTAGLIEALPRYIERWRSQFAPQIDKAMELVDTVNNKASGNSKAKIAEGISTQSTQFITQLLQSGAAIINLISLIVIMPVVSFYLLRDWDRLITYIDQLLPRQYAPIIREQCREIDNTLSGFVRGTLNVMLVLGTFYAIALSLVGLKFAIVIGIIGGVMIIIPYLGTIVSGVLAVGMAYFQFDDMNLVIGVAVIFAIGQMLEGYILTPKLVGDKVGLHPLWLIFGMLAGATLFGFVGIFLAVPVTAVIGVLVRFAIRQYRHSNYYDDGQNVIISEGEQDA